MLLEWEIDDLTPPIVSNVVPDNGNLISTIEVNALVTINRTVQQGTYSGLMTVSWTTGTLGLGGSWPVLVTATVLPPVLQVNGDPVTFTNVPQGGGTVTQTFEITNSGQSTLDWAIVSVGLPVASRAWRPLVGPPLMERSTR